MNRQFAVIGLSCACAMAWTVGCATPDSGRDIALNNTMPTTNAESEFVQLRDAYLREFKPLYIQANQADWTAKTTGSEEAFEAKEAADRRLARLHGNADVYHRLISIRNTGGVSNPLLTRELDVMVMTFLEGQSDPVRKARIVSLETEVEKIFNTHRSAVNGEEISENQVRDILKESGDSDACRAAWTGYMEVGRKTSGQLRELVKLRNESARALGYRDFFQMQLAVQEFDEAEFMRLFDELDRLTAEPFSEVKAEIDAHLAIRFGVEHDALRPWHYGDLFFQDAPETGIDVNDIYKERDLLALAQTYYESLGLACADIIARSDFYEKPGKSPHAFAFDIDRDQDVRMLCNLKDNMYWADTLLHELGHAVYDQYIDPDVPFILHTAAHSLITEGYAMMMGSMAYKSEFLTQVVGLDPTADAPMIAAARRALRASRLLFSRWTQVMLRFEKEMYANPDQDLAALWWELKARYQLLPKPDDASLPGYAAKIHVIAYPVYYHNYEFGDLFASQVMQHMSRHVAPGSDPVQACFFGNKKAGDFMRAAIFKPGRLYPWNTLTKRVTGKPLSAEAFAKQFVSE
jgi:peptidyl-dipeptidase A